MTVIEIRDLTKRYGDRIALAGVDLTVEAGEIVGLVGPNGAGKTTTVECVSGLRRPDAGRIRVLGLEPTDRRLREVLGVQLQEAGLPDRLTTGEALDLFASFYRRPAGPADLLAELGLTGHRDTPYARLSGGLKQRLAIALALVGQPKVAILDELTTGLDPQARRDTWELVERVRDRGVTILLVTHFMDEAQRLCDRVAVLHSGRIAAVGTPAQLAGGSQLTIALAEPLEPAVRAELLALDSVSTVDTIAGGARLAGGENLLADTVALLARHAIVPRDLRLHQASLEDAYLTLTGEPS
jgi:ABC-2 type transport system ATP-binding protein